MVGKPEFRHRNVIVADAEIHVVEAGDLRSERELLFLHGWPENWSSYEQVMSLAASEARAVAIDLPGIGGSKTPVPSGGKKEIARYVMGVAAELGLRRLTVVGHDAGGMIAYACLRYFEQSLASVVIMSTVIPGIDPWNEVRRNPQIFHWAFHATPELPERLVLGKQAEYFDFFYDRLAAHPEAITPEDRRRFAEAYATRSALTCSFDWFRAFEGDSEDNRRSQAPCRTPLLYLRGAKDSGKIEQYVQGLRDAGIMNLTSHLIPDCGHFSPKEQPGEVWRNIKAFLHGV